MDIPTRVLRPISIDTPKILQPAESVAGFTPRDIRKWADSLPWGHRGETTRQLYQTIQQANQLDLDVDDRFEIMESLRVPLDRALNALYRHLSHQALPLSDRSILTADLINDLLSGMAIGYRLILRAGKQKNWLYRQVHQHIWVTSLCRLLRYFELILGSHRILNMPRPQGLWRGIHRMFQQTREAKLHLVEVKEEGRPPTTIDNEYKKALLLSLLSRAHIRPDQFEEIEPLFDYWAARIDLRVPAESDQTNSHYCIPRDSDTPPLAMENRCQNECGGSSDGLLLDIRRLKKELQNTLREPGEQLTVDKRELSRESVESLLESWCYPHTRKEPRSSGTGQTLQVALGISTVHHIVAARAKRDTEQEVAETEYLESLQKTLAPLFRERGLDNEGVEVWNVVYDSKALDSSVWATDRQRHYPVATAEVLNFSPGGYCLRVVPCEVERVRNGDAVGMLDSVKGQWHLGHVRWLKGEAHRQVILGIKVLVRTVFSVGVRVLLDDGKHSANMPGLIGLDEKNELTLVIPYLPALRNKQLILDYGGHLTRIRLTGKVATTPSFVAYHLIEGSGTIAEHGAVATEVREAVVKLDKPAGGTTTPTSTNKPKVVPDIYADLWDKL